MADSLFNFNMNIREVDIKVTQQPNLATYPNLVDQVYQQLRVDDPNLAKQFSPEAFQYYATALLWMRILVLKKKFRDDLNVREREVLEKIEGFTFSTPEPIRLYLSALGQVETRAGQHIYPSFPTLPVAVAGNTPGYHSLRIDERSHNLYEEIPCLGTIITLIQGTLVPAQRPPQPQIPVVQEGFEPTDNLCFWHEISPIREEAKFIFQSAGITAARFPCSPQGTGFNFTFLKGMSSLLSTTATFKNADLDMTTTPEQGYLCQVVPTHPTANNDITARATTAEVIPRSLNAEAPAVFGMAVTFGFQLWKESFDDSTDTWCCVRPVGEDNPHLPPAWVNNRNARRTIPAQYDLATFVGMTNNMNDYLIHVVQGLVTAKR